MQGLDVTFLPGDAANLPLAAAAADAAISVFGVVFAPIRQARRPRSGACSGPTRVWF
jgi:hypothetical protein